MLSRLELVDDFVSALLVDIFKMPVNKEALFNIKLSLHEAIINAVKHGNKMVSTRWVHVDISNEDNQIVIQVKDQGQGFDFKDIPDPILPENLEKLNGRGIFLIQNAMDKVEFADEGRTIKMIKFL